MVRKRYLRDMDPKPQFLETELLFKAFSDALDGKSVEIAKPELEFSGQVLDIGLYGKDSRNIVNSIITNFLRENTDPYLYFKNNHIAIKRLGRTFQIVHLFPNLNLQLPRHFIYKDAEAYYVYRTGRVLEEINLDYMARFQPNPENYQEQYYTRIPLKVMWLEAEPVLIQPDKKRFVLSWIHASKKYPLSFLQRALEEEILLAHGITPTAFNPAGLTDCISGVVDDLWSKQPHKEVGFYIKAGRHGTESIILKDQFLRIHRENCAIQQNEVEVQKTGKAPEASALMSQAEVDALLKSEK